MKRKTAEAIKPLLVLLPIFGLVLYVFWTSDIRNRLISTQKDIPAVGSTVKIGDLTLDTSADKMYLHFYDQNCHYSKKNIAHLDKLIAETHEAIQWIIVTKTDVGIGTTPIERFGKQVKWVVDADGTIADRMGVFMTPQAVLLEGSTIYYRGNYTKNGAFCGADNIKSSNPAIAIQSKLKGQPLPFLMATSNSYVGCPL